MLNHYSKEFSYIRNSIDPLFIKLRRLAKEFEQTRSLDESEYNHVSYDFANQIITIVNDCLESIELSEKSKLVEKIRDLEINLDREMSVRYKAIQLLQDFKEGY